MQQCTSEGCDRAAMVDLLRVIDASLRRKCRKCAEELISMWPAHWHYLPAVQEESASAG